VTYKSTDFLGKSLQARRIIESCDVFPPWIDCKILQVRVGDMDKKKKLGWREMINRLMKKERIMIHGYSSMPQVIDIRPVLQRVIHCMLYGAAVIAILYLCYK